LNLQPRTQVDANKVLIVMQHRLSSRQLKIWLTIAVLIVAAVVITLLIAYSGGGSGGGGGGGY
jgi:hypothetical protein